MLTLIFPELDLNMVSPDVVNVLKSRDLIADQGEKALSTRRRIFTPQESTPYFCFWILRHLCIHGLGPKKEKLAFPLQKFINIEFSCMILILDSAPPLHSWSLAQNPKRILPRQKFMQSSFRAAQTNIYGVVILSRKVTLKIAYEKDFFRSRI